MADGEFLALAQDMTISRDAFLRSLPAAVGNVAFVAAGSQFSFREQEKGWRIDVGALPDLELGMFRLPRQRVQIFLTGYDETDARHFLDRFELYFRRAGG